MRIAAERFRAEYARFTGASNPGVVRFYCDGILYKTRTPADLPPGTTWVFDHPFFLILNVAVGGTWPGSPDAQRCFRRPCWLIMCGSISERRHAVLGSTNPMVVLWRKRAQV